MIDYLDNLIGVSEEMLSGFFAGWPNPPSRAAHMRILEGSSYIWLAVDREENRVAGFINMPRTLVISIVR